MLKLHNANKFYHKNLMKEYRITPVLPVLTLVIAAVIVYWPTWTNEFLYEWDDQWMLLNQYTPGGWGVNNIRRILTDFYNCQYAPFNQFIYMAIFDIFGFRSAAFHGASLLAHIANAIMVYYLLLNVLRRQKNISRTGIYIISFVGAFLFTIHPVNVESIAWISASKVPFYSLFFLAGIISYLKFVDTGKSWYYIIALLCFFPSFGAKEQAVTYPLMIIAIDWFIGRDMKNKDLWIEKFPFLLLALIFGIVTLISQSACNFGGQFGFLDRIVIASFCLIEYITKAIVPLNLCFLYPFPFLPGESFPAHFWAYPFIVLAIIILLVTVCRQNKIIIFSALLFIINLMFSINIISMNRASIVADRYFYLSGIGIFLLIGYGIYLLYIRWGNSLKFKTLITLFAFYCIALGVHSFYYTRQWKDSNTVKAYLRSLIKENKERKNAISFPEKLNETYPQKGEQ